MPTAVDHYLKIGIRHLICEDYCISGQTPFPHIIVSDGCSSSEATDVGARILTYLARKYLLASLPDLSAVQYVTMGEWIIREAHQIAVNIGLPISSLDATLIVAYLFQNHVIIHLYGDGFIGLVDKNKNRTLINISFSGNAPYYLSYLIDSNRSRLYENENFQKNIGNDVVKPNTPATFTLSVETYPIIVIATDGIHSFIDKTETKADMDIILKELTSFKTTSGMFVKRRVKRAVLDLAKQGFVHHDDIAVGAFVTTP